MTNHIIAKIQQKASRRAASMLLLAVGAAMISTPAMAVADPMIDGARQCTQHFPVEEQRNAIPSHLLAAIASTESGRWHNGLGMALPWPWTINVEGKGYYFNSKAEAIARVAAFQRSGIRSIDVGCMQVNLKHHPDAFASLDDAFEPAKNVAYAAKFLRSNYESQRDWVKATAAYHSQTPVFGRQYLGQIEKSWNRIVSKVQQARSTQGMAATQVASPAFSTTPLSDKRPNIGIIPRSVRVAMGGSIGPAHQAKIIQVSEQPVMQPAQTLVVRGGDTMVSQQPTLKVADARVNMSPSSELLVRGASDTIRQVRIDNPVNSADSLQGNTNSRFVFAN